MSKTIRKNLFVRSITLGALLVATQFLATSGASAAPNVCERSSCGSIGCTSYGFYPSATRACTSNTPQLRFETTSAANYYCIPPTRPSVLATYAVCWKRECPLGSSFDSAMGECRRDEKLTCPSSVGNPIDVRNGNKVQRAVDFSAGGLVLSRHYLHSIGSDPARPGAGKWSFGYSQTIEHRSTNYGSAEQDVYVLKWDDNVSYILKGTEETGFKFSDWQVPDFVSVSRVEPGNSASGWMIRDRNLREYVFDASGLLVEIRDPGRGAIVIQRAFDSEGKPASQTMSNQATGAILKYNFDPSDQRKIISAELTHNQLTTTFVYGYGSNGLLSIVNYPNGSSRAYEYANAGFPQALTSIIDDGQTSATWEYDGLGRAITNAAALGTNRTSLSFNADGTTTVSNGLGKEAIYRFQRAAGSDRVSSIEGQSSANCGSDSRSFTYTSAGRIESEADKNGNITRYTYNDRGLVTQQVESEGSAEQKIILTQWHPDFPRPVRIESPDQIKEFCYDQNGRLVRNAEREHFEPALTCPIQ